jgi:calpain
LKISPPHLLSCITQMAFQRETELAEAWRESNVGQLFSDPYFPADGRSLYFDPLHPPKGALPADSLLWCRVLGSEILGCDEPVTISEDTLQSVLISQGALGDNHFVSAMRVLACEIKNIQRLLVSDKYRDKGIYTFKFNKAGKWRYVHIDDRIPCRQSGRVHYCRNENPNETFAMLLEKAYAKLHGCYESLVYGSMESTIRDLTPTANVSTIKTETIPQDGKQCMFRRIV